MDVNALRTWGIAVTGALMAVALVVALQPETGHHLLLRRIHLLRHDLLLDERRRAERERQQEGHFVRADLMVSGAERSWNQRKGVWNSSAAVWMLV